MRRKCVEHICKNWTPATFVEFGSGTGDMTSMFLDRGFEGKCYDIGEENRNILRKNLEAYADKVQIIDTFDPIQDMSFDYLFAFEVLEHIENDADMLATWSGYLKPGGKILISVPAHMKKYSSEDQAVGHVRRYEKSDLIHLLTTTGYENINILNYGFPLGNLTRFASKLIAGDEKKIRHLSLQERSIKSGVERMGTVNKLSFLFNDMTLLPFNVLQTLFFNQDWGDGYVAHARKKLF